jgi:hypothetical protein
VVQKLLNPLLLNVLIFPARSGNLWVISQDLWNNHPDFPTGQIARLPWSLRPTHLRLPTAIEMKSH